MNKIDQIQTQIDYIDTRLAAVLLARQTAGRKFLNVKGFAMRSKVLHACDKLDTEKGTLTAIRVTLASEIFRLTQEAEALRTGLTYVTLDRDGNRVCVSGKAVA